VTHGDRYTIGGPLSRVCIQDLEVVTVEWDKSNKDPNHVNELVGNSACLRRRYYCGLDRCAWIWADALD
jgi:hypothetical protein